MSTHFKVLILTLQKVVLGHLLLKNPKRKLHYRHNQTCIRLKCQTQNRVEESESIHVLIAY